MPRNRVCGRITFFTCAISVAHGALACGSVSNDSSDAALDAGSSVDAGVDAAACRIDRPFGAPVLLAGEVNTDAEETHPTLTPDELTLFFARVVDASSSAHQIFVANRSAPDVPFGPAIAVAELNSTTNDLDPSLSGDALTIVIGTVRTLTSWDIWVASRGTTASRWDAPVVVPGIDDDGQFLDGAPFLRRDNAEILFMSDRGPGTYGHLFRADYRDGAASNVTEITELNTTTAETHPLLTQDGRTIFFASTRPDGGAVGLFDIWTASRPDLSTPFSDLQNVAELNSSADDAPGWLSPDGCRLYLDSGRSGIRDLLVAERPE